MRVLDLVCGRGLTSMYLAMAWGVQVFALDLWISAGETYARFLEAGLGDAIIPLHGDALDLPFAPGYFDALVCVDAYHYFGRQPGVLSEKIAPLVKAGGKLYIGIPGMEPQVSYDALPPALLLSWTREDLETIRSGPWWQALVEGEPGVRLERIWSMACHKPAWADWLRSDNPYAQGDRPAMEAGAGDYMCLLGMILSRQPA